ncbi:MAG: glycosyltransferase family 4 protein [Solirubrobacteraceae bacterium]
MRLTGARLKVGLAPEIVQLAEGSGHGNTWRNVLAELRFVNNVKLVRRGRADVWLASGHEPPPVGRPLVVQVHEASWGIPALREFLDDDFVHGIEASTREAVAAADDVITPSRAAADQVIAAYPIASDRVHAIAHGVDHALFHPGLSGGRERVGAPYILTVATLHPRKNLAAVREAAAALARAGLPHVLVIVGNPAPDTRAAQFEREATAPLPDHPGRIVHLHSLAPSQLAAVMGGAELFCLPSYFEGFGLPALEAMAAGTPVIVSDRGALPEVVGNGGLVVAPDPPAVSEAVQQVLREPELAEQMRGAAVRRASAFSWSRTAASWLAVLEQAAQR